MEKTENMDLRIIGLTSLTINLGAYPTLYKTTNNILTTYFWKAIIFTRFVITDYITVIIYSWYVLIWVFRDHTTEDVSNG